MRQWLDLSNKIPLKYFNNQALRRVLQSAYDLGPKEDRYSTL
ncbi:MAG: hypothetical protein CMIDDMOC_00897 [Sodalis sp. Fle]|nr:MAG: hypothetical protein CMIDDMOC_00897 [Sodalis sp. Fle]